MKKPKPIPAFKTEADERRFWESHDSADYIDLSKAVRVRFANLKPSTAAISDTESSADPSGHGTLR